MTNKPNILSNYFDQVPKSWEQYKNELNDSYLKKEIIEAFDKDEKEKNNPSRLFYLSVEDLKNIDIEQLEISINKEMKSFYLEWYEFWKWRNSDSKKEYPNEVDRDNQIQWRYYKIKDKRAKKKILNGTPNIQNECLGTTVGNLFERFEDVIQRDYCNITNQSF